MCGNDFSSREDLFLGSFPGFTCTSYALMAQEKGTVRLLVCCLLLVDLPIK